MEGDHTGMGLVLEHGILEILHMDRFLKSKCLNKIKNQKPNEKLYMEELVI